MKALMLMFIVSCLVYYHNFTSTWQKEHKIGKCEKSSVGNEISCVYYLFLSVYSHSFMLQTNIALYYWVQFHSVHPPLKSIFILTMIYLWRNCKI